MILTITSSGGFAGLGAGPDRVIDVDALPAELRVQVCDAFAPDRLAAFREALPDGAADMIMYHLKAVDGETVTEVDLREDALSTDMLDLIDTLVHPPQ